LKSITTKMLDPCLIFILHAHIEIMANIMNKIDLCIDMIYILVEKIMCNTYVTASQK
jgi:uncharacterized membrane protein (UPF0127 family)